MKSHYPSLELCKKLTAIGFPTTFQHIGDSGGTVIGCGEIPEGMFVCPSVMEMLDVMPNDIEKEGVKYYLAIWGDRCVQYYPDNFNTFKCPIADFRGTPPNALAEMILWLHENNYISFPK